MAFPIINSLFSLLIGKTPLPVWLKEPDMYRDMSDVYGSLLILQFRGILNQIAVVTDPEFGAVGDGITYEDAAFIRALATGLPVFIPAGRYRLKDAMIFANKGQQLYGAGKRVSIFVIDSTFNLAALGVFVGTSGEEGPQLYKFGIEFTQPDTAVRANLVAYPPAFNFTAQPRFTLYDLYISNSMTNIDMRGNSGGAFICQVEASAYVIGINIDGSLDSVRLFQYHHWPFGLTANQLTIFMDAVTIGLQSGRCDDIHINDTIFFGGKGIGARFYQSGLGYSFGNITNVDFDNGARLKFEAGEISAAAIFISIGDIANRAIEMTGGKLSIASCKIESAVVTVNPMISVTGAGDSVLAITGGYLAISGDMKAIEVTANVGVTSHVTITDIHFSAPINTNPVNPIVHAMIRSRLTFQGNSITDKGAGAGNFVKCDADEWHNIVGNKFIGWGLVNINPQVFAIIHSNNGVDAWINTFVPAITSTTGAFTAVTATCKYKQIGKFAAVSIEITVGAAGIGTAGTAVIATLPFNTAGVPGNVLSGRARAISGKQLQGDIPSGAANVSIVNYDNTFPAVNSEVLLINGVVETQ